MLFLPFFVFVQMTEVIEEDWVAGKSIHQVMVGGQVNPQSPSGVYNGFVGCIEVRTCCHLGLT